MIPKSLQSSDPLLWPHRVTDQERRLVMEQLQLLDFDRNRAPRMALPQELRDELVRRMAEAIVIIFQARRGEGDERVPSQDPS